MREGVESNPGLPSIGQTLDWYTGALNKGKMSEDKIKREIHTEIHTVNH